MARAAIALLNELEAFTCSQSWLTEEDRNVIQEDAGKRCGEITMVAMQKDPAQAQPLMLEWMQKGASGGGAQAQFGALMAMGR